MANTLVEAEGRSQLYEKYTCGYDEGYQCGYRDALYGYEAKHFHTSDVSYKAEYHRGYMQGYSDASGEM